jgi:translation initiation factor 5B
MPIRQPIVVFMGHIDHGKSSILERVRGISITKNEPGLITQSIRSYNIPLEVIKDYCGPLLTSLKKTLTIPGLLFLDSPGHAAFNNMRKIGGNLADIAVLVVDIKEGVKEQTKECLAILKQYKTPFVIALNKIDLIPGWHTSTETGLLPNIANQSSRVQEELDTILYNLVAKLGEEGLNAERFDRVDDPAKQLTIVPVSAKTGEGIPELLMVMSGLAQRFLEQRLTVDVKGPGKATILEVIDDKKLGTTLDIVLYDGTLQVNDEIVIAAINQPIETKVRALFELDYKTKKLVSKKEVHAATGVKLIAPGVKEALGGMPLEVANINKEKIKQQIQREVHSIITETGTEGIIAKADTIGSLEALANLLKEANIPVKKYAIGNISKKDISEAAVDKTPYYRAILGFNIQSVDEAKDIKQITHDVVYKIIEDYQEWKAAQQKIIEAQKIESITRPFKIKIMEGFIFRQSNPAVVGVRVEAGTVTTEIPLMKKDGSKASYIKTVQEQGKNVATADKGKEVAIAIPELTVGRQIKEGDILYADLTETQFQQLKKLKKYMKPDEVEAVKEIAEIKRKQNPLWGV